MNFLSEDDRERDGPLILSGALNKCMVSALMMVNAISATSGPCRQQVSSHGTSIPDAPYDERGYVCEYHNLGHADYLGPLEN